MDLPNKSAIPPAEDPNKKKIIPVVDAGLVVQAPRPMTRRFLDFVFAESPKVLVKRVVENTLVPRAKAGVEEALQSFIHGMFWGQGSAPMSSVVKGTVLRGGGVNYQSISSQPSALTMAREANTSRSTGNYEDLVCPTQEIAERLLTQLYEVFNQYRVVAVGDLYEMASIPVSPSDNAYGWLSLDGARITKERDGYVLALPRPTLI
jgi:hypothetical protein